MHRRRRLLLALLLSFLPHEAFSSSSSAAGAAICNRRCGDGGGGVAVPYPFGFSAGCPIALACDAANSTPLLPRNATTTNATAPMLRVVSFNSTASIFLVALSPLCNRTVPAGRAALSGANYGVSSRTGLFLRGGCHNASGTGTSTCSVPSDIMSALLRTAQCGGANESAGGAVTCVSSIPPNATAAERGFGMFAQWERMEKTGCGDLLTSAVYGEMSDGAFSLEFGVAEMGWWVDGNCSHHGGDMPGRCAANASCLEVETPSGARGHRCECPQGMDGDGFVAGDGCHGE